MAIRFEASRDRWNGAKAGFDTHHRYRIIDRSYPITDARFFHTDYGLTKQQAENKAQELNDAAELESAQSEKPAFASVYVLARPTKRLSNEARWMLEKGAIPTVQAEALLEDLKARGWTAEIRFPQAAQ